MSEKYYRYRYTWITTVINIIMVDSLTLECPCVPEPVVLPAILPDQALAVPLHLTSWRLQSRPKDLGLFFCKAPIHWTSVEQPGEVHSSKRECHSADFDDLRSNFRYVPFGKFLFFK